MEMKGLLYLLAAIVCSAAMTLFLKGFRSEGTNRYAIILGNYITCVAVGLLMLKEKALVLHPAGTTLLCGIIGGVLFVFSLVVIQRSIEKNGAILSSAFSRLGLVIPLIMSIFVFGEQPKPVQYAGIAVVLAAVWVINGRQKQDRPASILLLKSLSALPAFIAYSVFSVGTILFVTLVSRVIFKEKLGRYQLAGLGLIAVSLVLLNL